MRCLKLVKKHLQNQNSCVPLQSRSEKRVGIFYGPAVKNAKKIIEKTVTSTTSTENKK